MVLVILVLSSIIVDTANSPFNALSILSFMVSCDVPITFEIGVLSKSYSFSEISEI